ncbi:MAG: hypothetical protein AB7O43_03995 [Hyphomicrobiaceae bacterium]
MSMNLDKFRLIRQGIRAKATDLKFASVRGWAGSGVDFKSRVALEHYDFKASLDLKCDFEIDPGVGRI